MPGSSNAVSALTYTRTFFVRFLTVEKKGIVCLDNCLREWSGWDVEKGLCKKQSHHSGGWKKMALPSSLETHSPPLRFWDCFSLPSPHGSSSTRAAPRAWAGFCQRTLHQSNPYRVRPLGFIRERLLPFPRLMQNWWDAQPRTDGIHGWCGRGTQHRNA